MKLCIIYANCQGMGLAHFLRKADFPYEIRTFENFRFILKEQDPEEMMQLAPRCDLFIYQPTDAKYDTLCAQQIVNNLLPTHCRTLSFSYMFNSGMFPLCPHGHDIHGKEFILPLMAVKSDEEIIRMYHDGTIDFGMTSRFLACASEQARREVFTDIKMAEWIVRNSFWRPFFTENHPTSITFCALASKVMDTVGEGDPSKARHRHWNEVGLPCGRPLSRYAVRHFGLSDQPDTTPELDSEKCYLDLLKQVLATR